MGPALTHVSMKYGDSGWKHVTAEEAEVLFPKQSVPAGTRQFICECCGQYVSFTKDGINVRHFKHSRGEEDKTCEERVARNAECEIVQYNTYDFPPAFSLRRHGLQSFYWYSSMCNQDQGYKSDCTGEARGRT